MVLEPNEWIPRPRLLVEVVFLDQFLLVGRYGIELSIHAKESDLLPFEFFARIIKARVALAVEGPVVRFVEVLTHLFVEVAVRIVQVVHHGVEIGFPSRVPERGAFFLFEVGVVEVLVNSALDLVRDSLQLQNAHPRLVILLAKARIKVQQNTFRGVSGVLDSVNVARCKEMSAIPHGVRLIEHQVLPLRPIEFREATHRHQVLPQIPASTVPVVLDPYPINPCKISQRQFFPFSVDRWRF